MLSQLHFTVQGRNSLLLQSLGEHWKIASCQSSSKKASEGVEQFVSKWNFYLYGSAQTFKHSLYFCINSKWMISYPWIESLGMMMVKLALYWWCHLIVPALSPCQGGSEGPLWMFQHPWHSMQLPLVPQDWWLHPKQINSFWGATQRGFIFPGYACKYTAAQRGDWCAHRGENTLKSPSSHPKACREEGGTLRSWSQAVGIASG